MKVMKENEFDFDKIGKTTPYRTPENFFDDMQKRIIKKTLGERHQRHRRKALIITICAAAAISTGAVFLPAWYHGLPATRPSTTANATKDIVTADDLQRQIAMTKDEKETSSEKPVYKSASAEVHVKEHGGESCGEDWIEKLPDDELTALSTLADNDVFLN